MQRNWVLLDTAAGVWHDSQELNGEGWSVSLRTLRGGLSEGVQVVEIDNGALRVAVLPTRGLNLRRIDRGAFNFGWRSPIRGPVHPHFVPLMEPSGLGFLDGFDELLARCGLESNGAPEFEENGRLRWPLHGRISNKPAHRVTVEFEENAGEITLLGEVEETRFHLTKLRLATRLTLPLGRPVLQIEDTVLNLSDSPAGCQLLYHVNLGEPLLESGAELLAPIEELVPRNAWAAEGLSEWSRYPEPEPGRAEQVYFARLRADQQGWTSTLLRNATGSAGLRLDYDTRTLPCFSLWKNPAGRADGYVTGLEPATNFPNPRSFEEAQGRVVSLPPHGAVQFQLALHCLTAEEEVESAANRVAELAGENSPAIHPTPQPGWCS